MLNELQKILLLLVLFSFAVTNVSGQEDDTLRYQKKFMIKLGGGPAMMDLDLGYQLENQFNMELGRFFSLSAAYGTAHAYEGMNNVKRQYSANPDLLGDDFTRDQSLIYARLGFQITPLNTKYQKAYIGIGPSLNFYNFSGANIISTVDSTYFIMSNRNKRVFTYSLFGGYEFIFKQHYLLGLSFYWLIGDEPMYSAMFSGGYRF